MWLTKDKRSGFYRVYWTDVSGKQRSCTTKQTTELNAKAWARENKIAEIERAAKLGVLSSQLISQMVSGHSLTVTEAINRWHAWATQTLSSTTIEQMHITLVAWARDTHCASRQVSSISSLEINTYINRSSERKVSTYKNELSILRRFFEYLRGEGYISGNPGLNARLSVEPFLHLQRESKRRQPFTEEEVDKLLANTTGFWQLAVAIGASTGLRLGDIASLEWESLSENGLLSVHTDKTDTRVSIQLDTFSIGLLRGLLREEGFIFPEQHAIAIDPTRRATLPVQFGRICKKNGIEGKSFHSVRHYYVTKLAKEGMDIHSIAKNVGHSNVETTAIYNHA